MRDKVTNLNEWKEDHQPHGVFNCSILPEDTDVAKVIVLPMANLDEYVAGKRDDIPVDVLRCIVFDWIQENYYRE